MNFVIMMILILGAIGLDFYLFVSEWKNSAQYRNQELAREMENFKKYMKKLDEKGATYEVFEQFKNLNDLKNANMRLEKCTESL